MGGLALGAFLLALWRLWLPVTYQLGSKGVVERACGHSRHIDWLRVTRAELQPRGVLLLADRTQTPLAIIHGVFVPWRNRREQVIALVEHFAGSRIHDVSSACQPWGNWQQYSYMAMAAAVAALWLWGSP